MAGQDKQTRAIVRLRVRRLRDLRTMFSLLKVNPDSVLRKYDRQNDQLCGGDFADQARDRGFRYR